MNILDYVPFLSAHAVLAGTPLMFYRSGSLAAVTVGAMRNTSLARALDTAGRATAINPKCS